MRHERPLVHPTKNTPWVRKADGVPGRRRCGASDHGAKGEMADKFPAGPFRCSNRPIRRRSMQQSKARLRASAGASSVRTRLADSCRGDSHL